MPRYPSSEHRQASQIVVDFFSSQPKVESVILYGSYARGKATKDSCVDILVLISPEDFPAVRDGLKKRWDEFYESNRVFEELLQIGRYSHVDLDFIDGRFEPRPRDWTGGPDEFELEIGNTLVYSIPLWEGGTYFQELREKWLPYYDEALREERLAEVEKFLLNNLDHIPLYVERGLYFQAFNRLYDALREFLQALFISRRTYPIAYDKWIREQVEEILRLPELYKQLVDILQIRQLESDETAGKARSLRALYDESVKE